MDEIIDHHGSLERIAEPHHRRHARPWIFAIPATARVSGLLLACELLLAHRIELLLGAVAVIGVAGSEHLAYHSAIAVEALRLEIGPLVGIESEPGHNLEDDAYGLLRGALPVGVLHAQHEPAARATRVEPAVERGAHA